MLVVVKEGGPLFCLDLNGDQFACLGFVVDCLTRPLVAHEGKFVLLLTGDVVHLGNVLGGHSHQDVVEGVHHAVVVHGVNKLPMSHLYPVRAPITR